MVKQIAGSKVLLLGSGFGKPSSSQARAVGYYTAWLPRNASFQKKYTLTGSSIVTKPTVEVLTKSDVHVVVGMCN